MLIEYKKICTLPPDLSTLLESRGLIISNKSETINYLTNIGYFRLSAYFYPFLEIPKENHQFKENATFEAVMSLYRFDRKLRMMLLNEIEKIEVAIRSAITNIISHRVGNVFWMTDSKYFKNQPFFNSSMDFINNEYGNSKEDFIIHFKNKYSNPYPPAWMLAEILPLGVLCKIFLNFKHKSIKDKVARHFGLTVDVFKSWIYILSQLRNTCAHHCRIWNKEVATTAAFPGRPTHEWIDVATINPRRVYFKICIIRYFLFTVSPYNTFSKKLVDLFAKFPNVDAAAMGFPQDWQETEFWK